MIRSTYTYVVLEISAAAYAEIRAKLQAAWYAHAFHNSDGREVIDMHGIAVAPIPEREMPADTVPPGERVDA